MYFSPLYSNWVDFTIVIFVFLNIWEAWGRGFVLNLFDFLGLSLSFLIALKYYSVFAFLLSGNFSFPLGIAHAVGFFAVAFVSEIVLSYILSYAAGFIPKGFARGRINRLFGIFPSVFTSVVIATFILLIALSLPIRGSIKKTITLSKLGGFIISKTQIIERQLNKIFNDAGLETLNFLTVTSNPKSSNSIDLHFTLESHTIDKQAEQVLFDLVNKERASLNLKPLSLDEALVDLARSYGEIMFEKGYFSHATPEGKFPFDRMNEMHIAFNAMGENIAFAPTVSIAHKGLMESKGHRENILSKEFKKIGIGVIDGGIYGKMFVQEFTD